MALNIKLTHWPNVCTLHTTQYFFTPRQCGRYLILFVCHHRYSSVTLFHTHTHTLSCATLFLLLLDSVLIGQIVYIASFVRLFRKPNSQMYVNRFERDHRNQIEIHSFNAYQKRCRTCCITLWLNLCAMHINIDHTTTIRMPQTKC